MGLFGKTERRINAMELSVRNSFGKVRMDMDQTNAWLKYLNEQNQALYQQLQKTVESTDALVQQVLDQKTAFEKQSATVSDINKIVEKLPHQVAFLKEEVSKSLNEERLDFYLSKISKEILHVDRRVEQLAFLPKAMEILRDELEEHIAQPHDVSLVEKRITALQQRLQEMSLRKTPTEKLVQRVQRNTPSYIKAMVLSYIKKYGKMSAFQLREMIVEEQNLTSKSSFYRILEEVEQDADIAVMREGKEKVYLYKLSQVEKT